MLKFIKPFVRLQRIAIDARSNFHVLADQLLKLWLAAGTADLRTDRSTAFQYCRYDGLAFRPASVDLLFALVGVHETRLAADEGFIYFNFATQLVERFALCGKADAVEHEPSRLLSDAQCSVQFVGTDTVLAVQQHPNCREPLLKRDRRVFKDGTCLQRKARFRVIGVAFPQAVLGKVANLLRPTFRALHLAVCPAEINHKLSAIFKFREVDYRVSEGSVVAHELSLRPIDRYVKYILTLPSAACGRR